MVNTLGEEVYTSKSITNWVSGKFNFDLFGRSTFKTSADFTQRCLVTPESEGDAASKGARNDEVPALHSPLSSPPPLPLLIEWAKAKLMSSSWKDALSVTVGVSTNFLLTDMVCEPDTLSVWSLRLRGS
jgi:hypothetical protein